MLFNVSLHNRSQSFLASAEDNLLRAALGAGIAAPYGCATGTCGKCAAVLVQGDVETVTHSDYVYSREERRQGKVLLCCTAPRSDVVLDIEQIQSAADIPVQSLETRFVKSRDIGEGVVALDFKTSRSTLLRYLSGQSVRLTLPSGASSVFPLASCPCEGLSLSVHVLAGQVPGFAADAGTLIRGDTIKVDGPLGDFTLDGESTRPIVVFATEPHYGAIHSLLSQIVNLELEQPVVLFRHALGRVEPYLSNYNRSLSDALDEFSYVKLETMDESAEALCAALACSDVPVDWAASDVYVAAGEVGGALREQCIRLGALAERVRIDRAGDVDHPNPAGGSA